MVQQNCLGFFEAPRDSQIKYAKQDLGEEDDEHYEQGVRLLLEWLDKTPHMPKNYSETMVRNFYRFCKQSTERAKKKLEYYFLLKNRLPEIYSNRNPLSNEIETTMKTAYVVPLPNLTERGERLCVIQLAGADPSAFNMEKFAKMLFMILDLIFAKVDHPWSSDHVIIDGAGSTMAHCSQFLSSGFRALNICLIKAYAMRVKAFHIINAPPMLEKILGIVQPIMHKKMTQRFVLHKSNESLLEYFSEKTLPKDYGGYLKSIDEYARDWLRILRENADFFASQEDVKITGQISKYALRISELSGLEGSFRKLQID